MDVKELRGLTVLELNDKLTKEKATLLTLRLDRSMGALKNPYALRNQRKLIARINTLIKEKK